MATPTVQEVVDAYLRAEGKRQGQTKLAILIGTKRQGVNAIMNRKPGTRFTLDHLHRYATNSSIPTSQLFLDLAECAWNMESEIDKMTRATPVAEQRKNAPASEALNEIRTMLRELIEDEKKRK